jgi:hypothetical protein
LSAIQTYRWVFLYWMPYDNNLSIFAKPILDQLTRGVNAPEVAVVVEADGIDSSHLTRFLIACDGTTTTVLETTNSADIATFEEYLTWARTQFHADHWVLVFLGHGGRLDQISPDDHPDPGSAQNRQWLSIQDLSEAIQRFNSAIGSAIELLFLQNCCKGTLEAHYMFHDVARYTMASQTVLGAPNYYYEQVLQFVAEHADVDGGELAAKIMEFERMDMYNGYVVTNNKVFCELPDYFNPLLQSILGAKIDNVGSTDVELTNPYVYAGDQLVDVIRLLDTIATRTSADAQLAADFHTFVRTKLIYKYQQSPQSQYPQLTGLSMLWPTSRDQFDKYRYLPIFADLKLAPLFEALIFDRG